MAPVEGTMKLEDTPELDALVSRAVAERSATELAATPRIESPPPAAETADPLAKVDVDLAKHLDAIAADHGQESSVTAPNYNKLQAS